MCCNVSRLSDRVPRPPRSHHQLRFLPRYIVTQHLRLSSLASSSSEIDSRTNNAPAEIYLNPLRIAWSLQHHDQPPPFEPKSTSFNSSSRHGTAERSRCSNVEMKSSPRRQSSRSLNGRGSFGPPKRQQVVRAWAAAPAMLVSSSRYDPRMCTRLTCTALAGIPNSW